MNHHYEDNFYTQLGNPAELLELFNALPDILFFVKDLNSRIVGCNHNFALRTGFETASHLVGKTTWETSPKELAKGYVEIDRIVMTTDRPIYDTMELNQDSSGTVSWFVTTKIPLHDASGKVIGLAGLARDLKQTKRALEHFGRYERIFEYIETHIDERIPIPKLAALMNASVSKFERDFKQHFGTTPTSYLIRYRIKVACRQLIDTDKSIAQIAHDCGFYDQSAMTRFFTRQLSISPSAYRKRAHHPSDYPG
jgi:PAS domain S-box-containing protein